MSINHSIGRTHSVFFQGLLLCSSVLPVGCDCLLWVRIFSKLLRVGIYIITFVLCCDTSVIGSNPWDMAYHNQPCVSNSSFVSAQRVILCPSFLPSACDCLLWLMTICYFRNYYKSVSIQLLLLCCDTSLFGSNLLTITHRSFLGFGLLRSCPVFTYRI